ncbi:hypothetical protein ACIRBX_01470 [Kitasatospora sp. NPDC096147]|uniref:hypothetical protein n=1 Tax=Kitasatospora sp. NPDC096147 TaxID=3364093 RepID=UPI003823D045
MGSSYVQHRGIGYWVVDHYLELWLCLVTEEARSLADSPEWLSQAGEYWEFQATTGFGGHVTAALDRHVGTDPERIAVVLDLAARVLDRLRAWGEAVPREIANSYGTGGCPPAFDRDVPTERVLACGEHFVRLLRAELPAGVQHGPV